MPRQKAEANRQHLTDAYCRTTDNRVTWDTKQQKLCLRVESSGTRTFYVVYRFAGGPVWYRIERYGAIGVKEAREIARKIVSEVGLGGDPQGDKLESRVGVTLEQVHKRYVEKEALRKNKSWKQADDLMQKHVLPELGRRKIKEIERRHIRLLFEDLSDTPIQANSVLSAISAMFTWAVEQEIVPTNPCHGIEHHKRTPRERFLSNDEIRAVWPLFDNLGLHQSYALKLVLLTAQRPGEVSAMRWEHVDLEAGLWSMPGAQTPGWPGTKNKRNHEVPLTEPVLDLLRDLGQKPSGSVFPSTHSRGKPIGRPRTHKICAELGYKKEDEFTARDLRATAATKMDELGIIRQHISLVLNHVEGGITTRYIRHDKRTHKRAALEAWAAELMAILEGKGRTDHKADIIRMKAV